LVRRAARGGPRVLNFHARDFAKVGFKLELATERLVDRVGNPGCIRQKTIAADAACVLRGDGIVASAIHASCSLCSGALSLIIFRKEIPESTARVVGNDFEGKIRRCTSILAEGADGVLRNKRKGIVTPAFGDSEIPHEEARVKRVEECQEGFCLPTGGYLAIFLKYDGIRIGSIRSVRAKGRALIRVVNRTSSRSWIATATTEVN
jgi:hypothetical protein